MRTEFIANHDAHWGAMMGFDWMLETPSLLFNELDESESIDITHGIERLENRSGEMTLHSFLRENHFLTCYPSVRPNLGYGCHIHEIANWNNSDVEHDITLSVEGFGDLRAFASDFHWNVNAYRQNPNHILGFSGMTIELKPEQKEASVFLEDGSSETKDNLIAFTGGVLTNIEPAVCFYHKGWMANLTLESKEGELTLRLWIHKKNTELPPEEGILYTGKIWIQCALLETV